MVMRMLDEVSFALSARREKGQFNTLGESGKHGAIESVNIPRTGDGRGKIFIVYAQVESSMRAQASLNGRKFGGQPVSASFLAEEKYRLGIFSD